MATIALTPPTSPSPRTSQTPPLHRITVDEYERIGAAGVLENPSRLELIDGFMVEKMPKSAGHGYTTKVTAKALDRRLPPEWTWLQEHPVRIPELDEPEPGISVLRGSDADYRNRLPTAADVAMLVEVSESTLSHDRSKKRSLYARAGIPVYWVVNLVDRQVEVYTQPDSEGRYRSRKVYKPGQQVPVVIDGRELAPIAVAEIMP